MINFYRKRKIYLSIFEWNKIKSKIGKNYEKLNFLIYLIYKIFQLNMQPLLLFYTNFFFG